LPLEPSPGRRSSGRPGRRLRLAHGTDRRHGARRRRMGPGPSMRRLRRAAPQPNRGRRQPVDPAAGGRQAARPAAVPYRAHREALIPFWHRVRRVPRTDLRPMPPRKRRGYDRPRHANRRGGNMDKVRRIMAVAAATALLSAFAAPASASTPGADSRLSLDANDPGYVTSYFIATGDG